MTLAFASFQEATPTPAAPAAGPTPSIQDWVVSNGLAVLQAILVAALLYVVLRVTLSIASHAMRRARVDTGTQILVRRAMAVGFALIGLLMVLGILGASAAGLVTVLGAVGLAFSLAVQDILKNFFSGIYLLLERPFKVGDTIRVKDQQGTVENIGVRTTLLRTPDNVQVLVPNAIVFAEVVANHSLATTPPPPPAAAQTSPAPAQSPLPPPQPTASVVHTPPVGSQPSGPA